MTAKHGPDLRGAAARNAAADRYTDPALSFRDYLGLRIVERLAIRPGVHLLDACCGAGAVAIPAAAAVGRHGRVIAVDAADRLLEHAARRAAEANLTNVECHQGDFTVLPFAERSFDIVVCGFGIFYAHDMTHATKRLWELVRPGGKLLIATWAERLFEPANNAFWDAIRKVRPSLFHAFTAWDPIDTPDLLADLLASAGIPGGSVCEEHYEHPLLRPEDWWAIVLGSHYRAVVDQLAPVERDLVQALTLRPIADRGIDWINVSALFALARK